MRDSIGIQLNSLSKKYPGTDAYALKDVSLQVNRGEVYGFLGPNGAGKSTTIRTLLNFLQPSGGSAVILGMDIVEDSVEIKRHIGYLAGEVALYPQLDGRQFLDYLERLQPPKHRDYRRTLVDMFNVELHKPTAELSKGNRQKLGIVQAFMHEPEVLVLDEPTSGLDPLMQAAFYNLVETAKQNGAAVFLSSHDLAEVQKMCDRVGFIRGGELVAQQTIADLQQTAAHTFDITFKGTPPIEALQRVKGAQVRPVSSNTVSIQLRGELAPLFAVLGRQNVVSLEQHEINLEEEFLEFYGDKAA